MKRKNNNLETIENKRNRVRIGTLVLIAGIIIGSFGGYLFGYYIFISENENTQNQLSNLTEQIDQLIIEAGNNNENINNIIDNLEQQLSQINTQISAQMAALEKRLANRYGAPR